MSNLANFHAWIRSTEQEFKPEPTLMWVVAIDVLALIVIMGAAMMIGHKWRA